MGDHLPTPAELNRAGRRAAARKNRIRKAGAAMAAVPAALGTTALILGATAVPAGAATLTVTNLNKDGAGSLHDVAEGAANGDVIVFQAGLTGTITLDDDIDIDTSVTIQGPGAGVVTVSGGGTDQIFSIDGPGSAGPTIDVVISGLTLTGGKATRGAAINFDEANLTVRDAVITGNSATSSGGGIASDAEAEALVIENTLITGNTSGFKGGGVYFYVENGTFTMTNSTISNNTAVSGGGGAWIGAEDTEGGVANITITNSQITGNTGYYGGGLYIYYVDGNVLIQNTVISGNTARYEGGGIWLHYATGTIDITGSTISGNTAESDGGGGMWLGSVTGNVNVTGSVISGNTGDYGGGIYFYDVDGTATVAFTTIAENRAKADGGGIEWYANDGDLVIRNSTISGNTAGDDGGGIYFSTANDGALQVFNSTISGNTAASDGGGISFGGYYGASIIQTTITANTAADGAGIYIAADLELVEQDARATERAVERAAKKDAKAAKITEKGGTPNVERNVKQNAERGVRATEFMPLEITGTIVAGNIGPDIADVGEVKAKNSLIGTVSGTTVTNLGGNKLGVSPLLGPLADNGGPTKTHALLPGSPAIDAGPNPLTAFPGSDNDQRGTGYPRVVAGIVDIGAFEVQPIVVTPTFTG